MHPVNYLHLGKGCVARTDEIVGIFDLDVTSQSHLTRKYLAACEKAGEVESASEDLPRSFVVAVGPDGTQTVYLSQYSAGTLMGRMKDIY